MNPQNVILQIQTDSLAHTLVHAHGGVSRKKIGWSTKMNYHI